jgi:hypothetical protein
MVDLATGKYAGFNDTHLHEKLVQKEGMSISRQSVRRILRQAGLCFSFAGRTLRLEYRRAIRGR